MMTLPTFTAECMCLVPAIDQYLLQVPHSVANQLHAAAAAVD